jgi:hypothetical protein
VQAATPCGLLSDCLTLQLLAEDADMLAELQGAAAQHVAAALTAHTAAAAAGMGPDFMVAAEAAGIGMRPSATAAAADTGSSSRESRRVVCQLSLFQIASQYLCCFPGESNVTLPWLQLLARFHAVANGFGAQSLDALCLSGENGSESLGAGWNQEEGAVNAGCDPEGRMAAMSVALRSFDVQLPPLLGKLSDGVRTAFANCERIPTAAVLSNTEGSQLVPELRRKAYEQQQQQQPPVDKGSGHELGSILYWLHGDRLANTPPSRWQQHLAAHLGCSSSGGGGGGDNSSNGSSSSSSQGVLLVVDQVCDVCCAPLQQHSEATCPGGLSSADQTDGSGSSSSSYGAGVKQPLGCASCGVAQYCSQRCADAARKVHGDNCW